MKNGVAILLSLLSFAPVFAAMPDWFPTSAGRIEVDHGVKPVPACIPVETLPDAVLPENRPFEMLVRSSTPSPVYFWMDLKVRDADGREFSYRPQVVESGEGGKILSFRIPEEGSKPRVVTGLSFPCDENIRRGWFEIARVSEPAADASRLCKMDVLTGTPYHATVMPAAGLVLTLANPARERMRWKGRVFLRDFFGRGTELHVDCEADAGATVSIPLPPPQGMGHWRVEGSLDANGVHIRPQTTFAVLDPHTRTPKVPRGTFRFGMNYHVTRYDAQLRKDTMAAMNAIGVKLMRGDFAAFIQMQPSGPDDWNCGEMDRILRELEDHGIAVDAIIATTPGWAMDEKHRGLKNGPTWVCPAPPGVYERFCERLARHYGTRIDYYEIGNELDIVPASHLTVEEAVARQRECYRGIKKGCPDACVIPCGWTFGDSNHPMVSQKGFQERFMAEAKDVCDAHPLHLHGRYVDFVKGMESCFKWRKEAGVDLPWYANETACSSCWGQEDLTAVLVWQKILWARAHGSIDYIWYNLRSVGDDPMNGEHTYGVFLRDLHPRAPAASYSACSYVFGGRAFDAILRDTDNCQFYRFRGEDEIILTGWDRSAGDGRRVRVKTDAKRIESVDLMGNRTQIDLKNGAAFPLSPLPSAMVFHGATFAEPDSGDLAAERSSSLPVMRLGETEDGTVRFVLNRADQMKNLWEANADTERRIWKGIDDLSAIVELRKTGDGKLSLKAIVKDDKNIARSAEDPRTGDALEVIVSGAKNVLAPAAAEDGEARYEAELPLPSESDVCEIRVLDDDGEGLDGWSSTGEFRLR